jgi:hypothetical protein
MLLALALYASTAHANVPRGDLTCCTTTGERMGWTSASSLGSLSLPAACAHSSDTSASASIVEVLIAVRASDGGRRAGHEAGVDGTRLLGRAVLLEGSARGQATVSRVTR